VVRDGHTLYVGNDISIGLTMSQLGFWALCGLPTTVFLMKQRINKKVIYTTTLRFIINKTDIKRKMM